MRICIDSNQFIFGISGTDADSERLMLLLPQINVVIPRIVMKEVTRNLSDRNVRQLHSLLGKAPQVLIIDEPVPRIFVEKYLQLGLREKGDAFIGAFAEWQGVDYLISDNRHFLAELSSSSFQIFTPERFLYQFFPNESE